MSQELIKKVETSYLKTSMPDIKPGQTVEVDTIIRDKDKQRIQKFKGLVIRVKGAGAAKTFTVRKISYGVGVEKTFPFNSTNISAVKIVKYEPVRRSKLYFMRDRVGKAAMRIRKGRSVLVREENKPEAVAEDSQVSEAATEQSSETTDIQE